MKTYAIYPLLKRKFGEMGILNWLESQYHRAETLFTNKQRDKSKIGTLLHVESAAFLLLGNRIDNHCNDYVDLHLLSVNKCQKTSLGMVSASNENKLGTVCGNVTGQWNESFRKRRLIYINVEHKLYRIIFIFSLRINAECNRV